LMAYQLGKSLDSGGTPTTAQGVRLDKGVGTGKAINLAGGQTIAYEQINQGDSSEFAKAFRDVAQRAFDDAIKHGLSESEAVERIRQALSISSRGIEGSGVGDFLGLSMEEGKTKRSAQDALSSFGAALQQTLAPVVAELQKENASFEKQYANAESQLQALDGVIANLDTTGPLYNMIMSNRDQLAGQMERMIAQQVILGEISAQEGQDMIASLQSTAESTAEVVKKGNHDITGSLDKWWFESREREERLKAFNDKVIEDRRKEAEINKKSVDVAEKSVAVAKKDAELNEKSAASTKEWQDKMLQIEEEHLERIKRQKEMREAAFRTDVEQRGALGSAFRVAGHGDFNPYEGNFDNYSLAQLQMKHDQFTRLRDQNIEENNLRTDGYGLHLTGADAIAHRGFTFALKELEAVMKDIRDDMRITSSATSQTAANTGTV